MQLGARAPSTACPNRCPCAKWQPIARSSSNCRFVSTPSATTVICGDAIPTVEHLEAGRMHTPCHDLDQARESFSEAVEIADLLVLGRDNMVVNPIRRM